MIIIELVNEGTGWAELQGGDYTIYDTAENVLGTGSFIYSYPQFLAPGATGYLADEAYLEDAKPDDVKRVEADGTYDDVEEDDVILLETAKVQIKAASFGDGLHTTGTITNTSDEDVLSAHVGSFFVNSNGRIIGHATTNLVENLSAGQTKGFETLDSACDISRSRVEDVITEASSSW